VASNPAKQTEKRSQGTGLAIHEDIEDGVDEREERSKIEGENLMSGERKGEKGGRKLKEEESGVEDGPDEDGVDEDVDGVAVVGAVESEVAFEIE
jgi:hypothetical protein